MSFSILLSKTFLIPAAGTAFIGGSIGSTYYIYHNKQKLSLNTAETSTFLARVKTAGTNSITANKPLKCVIDTNKEVECKVSKFTTTKTTNAISKFEDSLLTTIATPSSDLTANSFVVVELKDTKLTFENLKNKSIPLKSESSELTTLEFDQVLTKTTETNGSTNKVVYDPIPASIETYIVSSGTLSSETNPGITSGFRCKYAETDQTSKLTNWDDTCKLIKIPAPASSKHITTLEQLKAGAEAETTLTANTYYKLTLDKNKLYNLDFAAAAANALTVEVVTSAGSNNKAPLTLLQKLNGDKFEGKTNLLLAQYLETSATSTYTGTDSKCSFDADGNTNTSAQFTCQFHVTAGSSTNFDDYQITATAVADGTSLTANNYFAIKFTESKNISDLTLNKFIYIHASTTSGSTATKSTYKFQIKALLSGSIDDSKKPFIIAQ